MRKQLYWLSDEEWQRICCRVAGAERGGLTTGA